MSCRVIRDAEPVESRPFFATEPRKPLAAKAKPWEPESPESTKDAAEFSALRSQVRSLETALQRKTAEAKQEGIQEGDAAGYRRGTSAVQPVLEKLSRAITEIVSQKPKIREEAESELITLALAIARRVLRRELTVDPDAIQGLVRAALDKVQVREITRVRIHSGHEPTVRQCLHTLGASGVELLSDPGLEQGDVVIETRRGNLEASIDTQLAEIERGFADRIGRS